MMNYNDRVNEIKVEKEIDDINWYAIVIGYLECMDRLDEVANNKKIVLSYIDDEKKKQDVACKYSATQSKTIFNYASDFENSISGRLYDVADYYLAQKVLMRLLYLCQHSLILDDAEIVDLKNGMAAYMYMLIY